MFGQKQSGDMLRVSKSVDMVHMPKTKKGRKRGKRQAPLTGLTDAPGVLPDRLYMRHTYSVYQILAPAAGGSTSYSFRGNSVFDPDFTGAGSIANLYNTFGSLYNRYRVTGSKINVEFVNTGTVPLVFYLIPSIQNAPPSVTAVRGQRHIATGTAAPGGPISWVHTASATTAKIFGVPPVQVLSEDDFAGLTGANPNNVWYWHLLIFNPGGVAGAVNVQVRLEYDTYWSMPLFLA
jgi:hypothetical protein